MSESIRQDPFTGTSVLIAPLRRGIFVPEHASELPRLVGRCPFCPGHEADTERAVLVRPETGPWSIRVVRNRYPVVSDDGILEFGAHEVLIESTEHDADLDDFSTDHLTSVLRAYRDRLSMLGRAPGIGHGYAFRNRGRRAGSSQPHPHGQIVAVSTPGSSLLQREHLAERGASGAKTLLALEIERARAASRIVEESTPWIVMCPTAPRWDHEVWVAPTQPNGCFADTLDHDLASLAAVLRRTITRMKAVAGGAYNMIFRLPRAASCPKASRFWTLELCPRRQGGFAGFELASEMHVVTVSPEQAAQELRAIAIV